MMGFALNQAMSLENAPGFCTPAPFPAYTVWPKAEAWVRSLTLAATCSCTEALPVRARRKAFILGKRSSVFTASAFKMACSMFCGITTPSSDGAFSVSPRIRSTESGGSCPVMQR